MAAQPAGGAAMPAPGVDGVLFDLDDTLLDLRRAQTAAFTRTIRRQWPDAPAEGSAELAAAAEHFASDAGGHYQRYVCGELSFAQQRLARAADALALLGASAEAAAPSTALWVDDYEGLVRGHWALFDDVVPALARLRAAGLGVGIVTNNVEAYQRGKADALGLADVTVLVGSDTAGAPKPDAAPFLEGCRRLGLAPERVACVGDSLAHDVRGARDAGLVPVWLRRPAAAARAEDGPPTWLPEERAWQAEGLDAVVRWLAPEVREAPAEPDLANRAQGV